MGKTRSVTFIRIVAVVMVLLGLASCLPPSSAIRASVSASPCPCTILLPVIDNNYPLITVFGIEMSSITVSGGLSQTVAAGTYWVRRNALLWSDVEPVPGARNWGAPSVAGLEQELINASSAGLQVILIVRSTPAWAQKVSGSFCGPVAPTAISTFGAFMRDAVARYSVAPYNVRYWEIGNEPDIAPSLVAGDSVFGCWGDQSDPYYGGGYYGQMLQAVYPQIKSVAPESQVLIGGLLLDCDPRSICAARGQDPKPPQFLEGVLRNGGGAYFDGVSYHAYDYYYGALGQYGNPNWSSDWKTTGPSSIAKANFIASVLGTFGVSGKFLMDTESAIICDPCSNDSVYETTKAYYIAQLYSAAVATGLRGNVWYSLLGWRNSGLLNADLTPRPAYSAFQFAQSELRSPTSIGPITSSDVGGTSGVTGYKFNRGGRVIWLLWSLDASSHTVTLSSVPTAAWDALGNPVTAAASMPIDLKPLYLEFP